MPIPFDEFKWRNMTRAINAVKPAPQMLLSTIFSESNSNETDTIDVDITLGGKEVVPFVSPVEGGTVVGKLGQEMRSVKTPRVRPKKQFTAQELLTTRPAGQTFYATGAGDINRARQRKVGQELTDLRRRVDITKEWMCGQALSGTITVAQDNLAFEIDYLMPSAHKPTASPLWDDTDPTVEADLQTWADLIAEGSGSGPTMCVMGANAAKAFLAHAKDSKWFDARRVNAGNLSWDVNNDYLGNGYGIEFYRYAKKLTDGSGTTAPVIPSNVAIFINPNARITLEHGVILDLDANARVVGEYFSKSWLEKDPSGLWMLAESRPLPVLWEPEAIVYATVTS